MRGSATSREPSDVIDEFAETASCGNGATQYSYKGPVP